MQAVSLNNCMQTTVKSNDTIVSTPKLYVEFYVVKYMYCDHK